jgi:hypothetical protein
VKLKRTDTQSKEFSNRLKKEIFEVKKKVMAKVDATDHIKQQLVKFKYKLVTIDSFFFGKILNGIKYGDDDL